MWNYFDQIVIKSYSLILLAIIPIISIPVLAQESVSNDSIIPPWVKGVANFWVEDKIDDGEFAEALEFLIDSEIIQLGNNIIQSDSIVIVPEQEIDWEEKFDKQEKEYKSKSYSATQEHNKIANEMDEKYNNLKKQTDVYVKEVLDEIDIEKKEWKETYNKISEENAKLKAKIKQLEK